MVNFRNKLLALSLVSIAFIATASAQPKPLYCGSTDPAVKPVCAQVAGNYAYQVQHSEAGQTLVMTGVISLDGLGNLDTSDSTVIGEVRTSRKTNSDVTLDIDKGDGTRPASGAIIGGNALIRFHLQAIAGHSYMVGPYFVFVPVNLDTAVGGCGCYRKLLLVGMTDSSLVGVAEYQSPIPK